MEAWICPFCHKTLDNHEIKDHISKEHFGVQAPLPPKTDDLWIKQEPEQIQVVPDFVLEGDSSLDSNMIEEQSEEQFLIKTEDYDPKIDEFYSIKREEWHLVKNEVLDHSEVKVEMNLKQSFMCQECSKVFTHRKSLSRHVKSAHDDEIFHCDYCGKDFNHKENLKRHVERVHGNTKHECFKCQQSLSSKDKLLEHIKSVHEHIKYDCERCQKSFATKDGLNRHIKTVHEGLKQKQSKVSGLRGLRNDDKASVECKSCNKVYASKKALWRHNSSIHKGIKHECSTCQKIFSTKDTLGRHIKSVHLKLKRSDLSLKHDCLQCPRSFRDKRDLNVHVASVHEGIRIHCEHCQSHFNALKSYKRHLARKHGFSDE